ncbi:hypothetical protein ES703_05185 [subsurface metagenome]
MPEISLKGEKYIGIFNGDKREVDKTKDGINYHHEWYDGAGFIRRFNNKNRSNSKKYFFRFLVREDSCKSTLKETLEKLASRGCDSFLESILLRRKESQKHIPKIYLPK